MRTWLLSEHKLAHGIEAYDGPQLAEDEQVRVIELDPVLALLKRLAEDMERQNEIQ